MRELIVCLIIAISGCTHRPDRHSFLLVGALLFSGYYNKPFGKSRLTELFSTFITVLIGTIFVFFALLLDDIPRSINIYYRLFFGMFGLQFFITYIPRLLITQSGVRK